MNLIPLHLQKEPILLSPVRCRQQRTDLSLYLIPYLRKRGRSSAGRAAAAGQQPASYYLYLQLRLKDFSHQQGSWSHSAVLPVMAELRAWLRTLLDHSVHEQLRCVPLSSKDVVAADVATRTALRGLNMLVCGDGGLPFAIPGSIESSNPAGSAVDRRRVDDALGTAEEWQATFNDKLAALGQSESRPVCGYVFGHNDIAYNCLGTFAHARAFCAPFFWRWPTQPRGSKKTLRRLQWAIDVYYEGSSLDIIVIADLQYSSVPFACSQIGV